MQYRCYICVYMGIYHIYSSLYAQHVCTVSLCLCYTNSSFSPYVRAYKIKYTHIVQIFTAFIYRKCMDTDLNIHPACVCCIYAQYIWCPRTRKGSVLLNWSRMFVFKYKIFSEIPSVRPWGTYVCIRYGLVFVCSRWRALFYADIERAGYRRPRRWPQTFQI